MNQAQSILIVDDERRLADSLCDLLRQAGYEAVAAYTGREALDRLEAHPFPLVITDLRMDGMDGLALIAEIARRHPSTQMIVMTGYASTESAIAAVRCRVFDYLCKPFDFQTMRLAVEKAFQAIEAERLRQDTAAMLSHDMKIPLTSILGFAAMIYDRETGRIHERAAEFAETIEANGQKILQMIDNYLASCRLEAGSFEAVRAPVDLGRLMHEVAQMPMFARRRSGCELVVDAAGLPGRLHLDESLIYRALINLLHNAIKYARKGGEVVLSARLLKPESDGGAATLCIDVENTVHSIDPMQLDGVFERFRRGISTGGIEGTGIGLYVVAAVARAHGGRAEAHMVAPDRVRFSLVLPVEIPGSAESTDP